MTTTDAERLGNLLAAARARTGLSTPQLAAQTGVSQSNIVRLEQGRIANPSAASLQRLGAALGIPLGNLYELAGIPLPSLQPYLRASYGLSPEDAARAQAYVEQLAERYGADGSGPPDGADEEPLHEH